MFRLKKLVLKCQKVLGSVVSTTYLRYTTNKIGEAATIQLQRSSDSTMNLTKKSTIKQN